ncbi:cytochrome c oxidase assembly protein [Metabacillus malikii]|uniref:Membrane protein n=1 Tax=Metabacillus malikii TaxID=1504265 RepID=A0ABT9ZGT4_9BACI|nr:cytochrome c oxidase assembly protein [Metabacillus malikii]MDQ0230450.1 putative membrane protein [Metabacillus malikii]
MTSLVILFLLAMYSYIWAVHITNQKFKDWPKGRIFYWFLALICIASVFPLANFSHGHVPFSTHMLIHLLIGMLAPLLFILSAPMTLILRTLNVNKARLLMKLLKSRPSKIFLHPIFTLLNNIGVLWILYTTNLYALTHQNMLFNFLIHLHVFFAGYLFTLSMIYIEPLSHRYSFTFRSTVLIIALTGHGILSKYIYANPPAGVARAEAELGGYLMYYGGDFIDFIIIFILCHQWYQTSRKKAAAII